MSLPLHIDVQTRLGAFELRAHMELQAPVVAVFGRSGAGKTTLLQLVAGLLRPERGVIRLGDRVWLDTEHNVFVRPEQRGIGYVFQDGRLFPHMNVRANLRYARRQGPAGGASFDDLVDLLELSLLLDRSPTSLSGGERQRVAFARALLSRPSALLCDEPLAAVEHGLRRTIVDAIAPLLRAAAIPVLYVSHNLTELLHLTRDFALLDGGCCVGCGDYSALFTQGTHEELAERLGMINMLSVSLNDHAVEDGLLCGRLGDQRLWMPFWKLDPKAAIRVALRPEDITLAREPVCGVSMQNQLAGIVRRRAEVHGLFFVQVDTNSGQQLVAKITPRAYDQLKLQPGTPVLCLFKASALHLI